MKQHRFFLMRQGMIASKPGLNGKSVQYKISLGQGDQVNSFVLGLCYVRNALSPDIEETTQ